MPYSIKTAQQGEPLSKTGESILYFGGFYFWHPYLGVGFLLKDKIWFFPLSHTSHLFIQQMIPEDLPCTHMLVFSLWGLPRHRGSACHILEHSVPPSWPWSLTLAAVLSPPVFLLSYWDAFLNNWFILALSIPFLFPSLPFSFSPSFHFPLIGSSQGP